LLPSRIALDEWGFPLISPAPIGPDEQTPVRRAIGVCPALALRVEGNRK